MNMVILIRLNAFSNEYLPHCAGNSTSFIMFIMYPNTSELKSRKRRIILKFKFMSLNYNRSYPMKKSFKQRNLSINAYGD